MRKHYNSFMSPNYCQRDKIEVDTPGSLRKRQQKEEHKLKNQFEKLEEGVSKDSSLKFNDKHHYVGKSEFGSDQIIPQNFSVKSKLGEDLLKRQVMYRDVNQLRDEVLSQLN